MNVAAKRRKEGQKLVMKAEGKESKRGGRIRWAFCCLTGAESPCRFFILLSLWLGCRAAAPLDVFLATDLLKFTSRAGIAMELLTSGGVVVSLEAYSQSC